MSKRGRGLSVPNSVRRVSCRWSIGVRRRSCRWSIGVRQVYGWSVYNGVQQVCTAGVKQWYGARSGLVILIGSSPGLRLVKPGRDRLTLGRWPRVSPVPMPDFNPSATGSVGTGGRRPPIRSASLRYDGHVRMAIYTLLLFRTGTLTRPDPRIDVQQVRYTSASASGIPQSNDFGMPRLYPPVYLSLTTSVYLGLPRSTTSVNITNRTG